MYTTKCELLAVLLLVAGSARAAPFKECENIAAGAFIANGNCLSYVYCNGNSSYTGTCPRGTYFDAVQQHCALDEEFKCFALAANEQISATDSEPAALSITELPIAVIEVEENQSTEQPPFQLTASSVTPPTVGGRPQCRRNLDDGIHFAHPLRCEYYYRCVSGYLTILRCNFNYAWDYERELCVPVQEALCFKEHVLIRLNVN